MRSEILRLGVLHNGVDPAPLDNLLHQFKRYQFSNLGVIIHRCGSADHKMRRVVSLAQVLLLDTGLGNYNGAWRYLCAHRNKPVVFWAENLDADTVVRIETLGLRHRQSIVFTSATTEQHSLPNKSRVIHIRDDDSAYRAAIALRCLFPESTPPNWQVSTI
jgi:hypothetical protein